MYKKYFTPNQLKAARALVGWNQQQLAEASGAGVATIRVFEGGRSELQTGTATIILQALDAAGVEFIPENGGGAGVRLKKDQTK